MSQANDKCSQSMNQLGSWAIDQKSDNRQSVKLRNSLVNQRIKSLLDQSSNK